MSSSAPPSTPAPARGRLARWLLHPATRTATLALLLLGFAVGVAVYMEVVNRYVHFSVQLEAPAVVAPGTEAPVRVHLYRPERRQRLRGTATFRDEAGDQVAQGTVVTGVAVPFSLPVPPDAADDVAFELQLQVDGEEAEAARLVDLVLPVRPVSAAAGVVGLPAEGSARRVHPQAASERARVERVRVEPEDAGVSITIVPETGFPVRFLENRFYLRVTRDDGTPLSGLEGVAHVFSEGEPRERPFRTDAFGLAEIAVTPRDIESWRVETTAPDGRPVVARFELVPGFDGLIARPFSPLVEAEQPLALGIASSLTTERWYYDLFSGDYWLASGLGRELGGLHALAPPGGRWPGAAERVRFARLQVYTSPFVAGPQSSVVGLLLKPPGMGDLEAASALVGALATRALDTDWLRALQRADLLDASTAPAELRRLVAFLLVRLLPTYAPPRVAFDDTAAQSTSLLADTTAFRTRMHWLLGLGVLGLLSWIVGRVVVYTVQTRRRTRLLLAELDDAELTDMDASAMAEMRTAILPVTVAAITIVAFFLGVLFMLATM